MKFLILAGLLLFSPSLLPTSSGYSERDPRIMEVKPTLLHLSIWRRAEWCVGRKSPVRRVRWFVIPDSLEYAFRSPDTGDLIVGLAVWQTMNPAFRPEIYVLERLQRNRSVLTHEIVHIVSNVPGHPGNLYGPGKCAARWFME